METSYNCTKWCSTRTYQKEKVDSSIVSKDAMNSFNEMFPLARMFPPAVMHTPCGFSKNLFFREKVKPCCFVTFNIMVNHIFPENSIEITQVVQIFFFNINYFYQFLGYFDISLLKRNWWRQHITGDVSITLLSTYIKQVVWHLY